MRAAGCHARGLASERDIVRGVARNSAGRPVARLVEAVPSLETIMNKM
jgi:hypothetical protein